MSTDIPPGSDPPEDSFASEPAPRRWPLVLAMLVALAVIYAALAFLMPQWRLPLPFKSMAQANEDPLAMTRARDALIAWSRSHNQRPGSLPCPDLNSDGLAEPTSMGQCPNTLGRFPWKTLGFERALRDRDSETLWYAISPSLRDDPTAQPINMTTPSTITLDGQGGIAALIIAPGDGLTGQEGRPTGTRTPGNNVSDYLEGPNADTDLDFATRSAVTKVNDGFVPVLQSQLMGEAGTRLLEELAPLLAPSQVQKGSYPADDVAFRKLVEATLPPGHWILSNLWLNQARYTLVAPDTMRMQFAGCKSPHVLKFPSAVQAPPGGC